MSLREKTEEVVAEGEATRGNFTPTGVPKRAYEYWLSHSRSSKAYRIKAGLRKENFCHYWRVVLIWSLLTRVRVHFEDNAGKYVVLVALLGIAAFVYALLTVGDMWLVVLQVLVVVVTLAANVGGALGAGSILHFDTDFDDVPTKVAWPLVIVGPAGAALMVLASLVKDVATSKTVSDARLNHPREFKIGLGALALAVVLSIGGLAGGAGAVIVMSIIVAAVIGLVALAVFLIPIISDRLEKSREERHNRYIEYINEHGLPPEREPGKWETRFDNFFRGIGDFVVFLAQVVRVNKWKICPLVEIETEDRYAA